MKSLSFRKNKKTTVIVHEAIRSYAEEEELTVNNLFRSHHKRRVNMQYTKLNLSLLDATGTSLKGYSERGIYAYDEDLNTHYIITTKPPYRAIPIFEQSLRFVSNFADYEGFTISEGDVLFDVEYPNIINIVRFDRNTSTFFKELFELEHISDEEKKLTYTGKHTPILSRNDTYDSVIVGDISTLEDFNGTFSLPEDISWRTSKSHARYEKYGFERHLL